MKNVRVKKFSEWTESTLGRSGDEASLKKATSNTSAGKRVFGSKAPSVGYSNGAKVKR